MRVGFALLGLGAWASACAADPPCCYSQLTLEPGARYVTFVSNPDGGVPTRAEAVITSAPSAGSPGVFTVTFTNGGREVTQRFSTLKR